MAILHRSNHQGVIVLTPPKTSAKEAAVTITSSGIPNLDQGQACSSLYTNVESEGETKDRVIVLIILRKGRAHLRL